MGQLSHALCKSGFVKVDWPGHVESDVKRYVKQIGIRKVFVHLWYDGEHSMHHSIDGILTEPMTHFRTKFEMKHALRYECMRTDGKFFQR